MHERWHEEYNTSNGEDGSLTLGDAHAASGDNAARSAARLLSAAAAWPMANALSGDVCVNAAMDPMIYPPHTHKEG